MTRIIESCASTKLCIHEEILNHKPPPKHLEQQLHKTQSREGEAPAHARIGFSHGGETSLGRVTFTTGATLM